MKSLADLMQFEAPFLERRAIAKGIATDGDEFAALFMELKRYLALAAMTGKRYPMHSHAVDELWHDYILHTRDYASFCQSYFGSYIHHQPEERGSDDATAPLDDFLSDYAAAFGPPPALWSGSADCSRCGATCRSCSNVTAC